MHATRIKFRSPPSSPSKWLSHNGDHLPLAPVVVVLETKGLGSILNSLECAFRQQRGAHVETLRQGQEFQWSSWTPQQALDENHRMLSEKELEWHRERAAEANLPKPPPPPQNLSTPLIDPYASPEVYAAHASQHKMIAGEAFSGLLLTGPSGLSQMPASIVQPWPQHFYRAQPFGLLSMLQVFSAQQLKSTWHWLEAAFRCHGLLTEVMLQSSSLLDGFTNSTVIVLMFTRVGMITMIAKAPWVIVLSSRLLKSIVLRRQIRSAEDTLVPKLAPTPAAPTIACERQADLQLLYNHHSKPEYRELMGRKAAWESDYGWSRSSQQASWHGKGGGKERQRWPKEPKEQHENKFPSYDGQPARQGPQTSGGATQEANGREGQSQNGGESGDLVRYIQKLANTVRRADARIRKSDKDREDAEQQWQQYQEDLKKSFLKERTRHFEKLGKLRTETQEQQVAKEQAIVEMKEILAHPEELPELGRTDHPVEALEEWEHLTRVPDDPMSEFAGLLTAAAANGGKLRKGARKQMLDFLSAQEDREAHNTPPRRTRTTEPMTPAADKADTDRRTTALKPTYVSEEIDAKNDPYLNSPGMTGMMPGAAREPKDVRRPSQPRMSIKCAGRTPNTVRPTGPALGEKLDAKRGLAEEVLRSSDEEDMVGGLGKTAPEGDENIPPRDFKKDTNKDMDAVNLLQRACETWDVLGYIETWQQLLYLKRWSWLFEAGRAAMGLCLTLSMIVFLELCACLRKAAGTRTGKTCIYGVRSGRRQTAHILLMFAVVAPEVAGVPDTNGADQWRRPREAMDREIWERPLGHFEREATPPEYAVPVPETVQEPPQAATDRAIHISIWVATPHYSTQTQDVAMEFPVTMERLESIITWGATIAPDHFTQIVATYPQLHEDYASFIACPPWLASLNRYCMVLDCQAIGGSAFAIYHEGPLTKNNILAQVPATDVSGLEVFLFGQLNPMSHLERRQPMMGGLIKVLYRGEVCDWASDIGPRLMNPALWRPETDHPPPVRGQYTVYQGVDDQVVCEIEVPDPGYHEVRGADELDIEEVCWSLIPGEPPEHLSHGGQIISAPIAILPHSQFDHETTYVVFLDLRPLTYFPQWMAFQTAEMNPQAYLEGIQFPVIEGWEVVVTGGEPNVGGPTIRIRHGEVITFHLQPIEDQDATESMDEDGSDQSSDSSTDPDDHIPGSSEFSSPSEPPGGDNRPRGPPPSQPVNRSRSPRRRTTDHEGGTASRSDLRLAQHLPAPTFDLTRERLQLPHSFSTLWPMFCPWPLHWLHYDFTHCQKHPAAQQALQDTVDLGEWREMMRQGQADQAEFQLYTDGSASRTRTAGGYGVVILLKIGAMVALLGAVGGQFAADGIWPVSQAVALDAEQAAIAVAILWAVQMRSLLPQVTCTICFDCMAAGYGASGRWSTANELGDRIRSLEIMASEMNGVDIAYQHVKGHAGNGWNELADCVARSMAEGKGCVHEPPENVIRAFLNSDLTWVGFEIRALATNAAILEQGHLVWNDESFTPYRLPAEKLIPLSDGAQDKGVAPANFQVKACTVNVQGVSGQFRYFEEQLEYMGVQIAFLQETKAGGGQCMSQRYYRMASASQRHWGVAIWMHRSLGLATLQGRPVVPQEENVTILHEGPRLLAVTVKVAEAKIGLVAAHCPQGGNRKERDDFISELDGIFTRLKNVQLLLCGVDLNGRMPLGHDQVTGDLAFDEPDATGRQCAEALAASGLWAPSTFATIHVGDSCTYCHPSGSESRIDYLFVGGRARIDMTRSEVRTEFDNGSPNEDHRLVQVILPGEFFAGRNRGKLWRPQFDKTKMATEEGRKLLQQACEDFQQPPWHTHPDLHCQMVQDHLVQCLQQHFKADDKHGRASYIPQLVWDLRDQKNALKQRTRERRSLWARLRRAAFDRWARGNQPSFGQEVAKRGLLYELVAGAVTCATARIKKMIAEAKNDFLHRIATEGQQTVTAVLQRARKEQGEIVRTEEFLAEASQWTPPGMAEWNWQALPNALEIEKAMRTKVNVEVQQFLHPLHCGSKKHTPILFPSLFIIEHLRRCQQRGKSMAILFVDCRAAYYRVVRELALGDIRCDGTIEKLFKAFDLDGDDIAELLQLIVDGGIFPAASIPEQVTAAVRDFHNNTWSTTRFTDGQWVCTSAAGSRPGASWADTIFAFVYAKILYRVHEIMEGEGINFQVAWNPTEGPFARHPDQDPQQAWDTTWADDTAWAIEGDSAEQLLERTARVSSVVVSQFRSHGLSPNLKREKTSIILRLVGKGATQARRTFFTNGKPEMFLPDLKESIPIVQRYKHLGAMVDPMARLAHEARYRTALASAAYDAAKDLLLQNQDLRMSTRTAVFNTAVVTTYFNLAIWIVGTKEWRMMSDAYSRLVRRLLAKDIKAPELYKVPTPLAHWATGCWPLEMHARRSRISALISLATAGPPVLWAILQNEAQWMRQLRQDLEWLVHGEEEQWPLLDAAAWPHWHHVLTTSPARVKRRAKRRNRQDFEAYKEEEAVLVCQWFLYRTIAGARGGNKKDQSWDHLRFSGQSVKALLHKGKGAAEVVPGYGSRGRRQRELDTYTPAAPRQDQRSSPSPTVKEWNSWTKQLHEAVCEIVHATPPDDADALKPLYESEIQDALQSAASEAALLQADPDIKLWSEKQFSNIVAALQKGVAGSNDISDTATQEGNDVYARSSFKGVLESFDWKSAVETYQSEHGTQGDSLHELPETWEAAWISGRGELLWSKTLYRFCQDN
ncbi:unnamed protein product [Symbiodinium sp. CCMP2456]|nr:unnamed protein product [Symbiodinium sp. CCMP2456]